MILVISKCKDKTVLPNMECIYFLSLDFGRFDFEFLFIDFILFLMDFKTSFVI